MWSFTFLVCKIFQYFFLWMILPIVSKINSWWQKYQSIEINYKLTQIFYGLSSQLTFFSMQSINSLHENLSRVITCFLILPNSLVIWRLQGFIHQSGVYLSGFISWALSTWVYPLLILQRWAVNFGIAASNGKS